ncbi:hypothetical protein C3747_80g52 [Trypanosoma cruzi]|uniref:DUF5745 domain-containing protein n=2 Tax=Trypanosoma cruzi TaxID=5693 RepID=Q4CS85_TRYCC|nr:hypothetical protein, conserved [Trypanosoma cruzi]EAN83135.1 hypothetical protein, conserved [Trypanosoma cruzi]PWV09321.1 hypothetical protein C3747_80g52 [Trypanosoma cruzi]|eukprot:XP_804986.1 hypothetical protein [Trypanosoma cruzi strain CL Brener]
METPKVTCDDVNELVAMCSISLEKAITSLQQCSSSLFVLLYQRLYNCTIKDIESSPYTLQQKQWNVTRVLNELRDKRGIDVAGIDAEQIIQFNEEHISRLITLFLNIAYKMRLQGGVGAGASIQVGSGKLPSTRNLLPTAVSRPVLAELPHESAEDGTWYAPVRTVEEGERMLHMDEMHFAQFPQEHAKVAPLDMDEGRVGQLPGPLSLPHHTHHGHHRHVPEMEERAGGGTTGDVAFMRSGEEDEDEEDILMGTLVKDEHEYGGSAGSYGNGDEEEIPTNQLVNAWNAEVIPPKQYNRVINSYDIADVRERLSLMEEQLINEARQRERRQRAGVPRHLDSSQVGFFDHDGKVARRLRRREKPKVVFPRSLVPDTVSKEDFLRQEPKRMIDYTLRNEKIEMLRSVRLIDDLQKEIRRKMFQRHNDATRQLRENLRQSLEEDRREKLERMRQIKDEDQKYRSAYKAIMAAACNDLRTAEDLMMERTRQLAEYHSHSLRESRRMCQYMKRESKERMRHDLLRYASTVTGWQSHFVS